MSKISAVICAAGRGERAGFGKNKLLAPLNGAPALFYTLEAFDLEIIDEVIVASSAEDFEEISALCSPFGYRVVTGGETRTLSVYNSLKECTGDIVLIHDGARPYVEKDVIERAICCAEEHGSAICAVPVTDTVAVCGEGEILSVPERSTLFALQTPQVFWLKDILSAYELDEIPGCFCLLCACRNSQCRDCAKCRTWFHTLCMRILHDSPVICIALSALVGCDK